MSEPVARREGQPVLFLGLLFGGWFLLRLLTWENPWPDDLALPPALRFAEVERSAVERGAAVPSVPADSAGSADGREGWRVQPPLLAASRDDDLAGPGPSPGYEDYFDTHRRAMGHNLLFAAGMAHLPLPRSMATALERAPGALRSLAGSAPEPAPSLWRFDGWITLREGRARLAETGPSPASYGASQIGAVLAYRLAPASRHAPAAYMRVGHALAEDGETDAALGLRARPLVGIPLTVHAEARLTHRPGRGAELRPAAFVAGGVDSLALPGRVSARLYGQAGYVGGTFATAFADGAIVAEREVARFDLGEVSLGAGLWGGAQRGAARLDLGPSVSLKVELGGAPARIGADYRWRVAGDAQPGNGGVLTLSTGF